MGAEMELGFSVRANALLASESSLSPASVGDVLFMRILEIWVCSSLSAVGGHISTNGSVL